MATLCLHGPLRKLADGRAEHSLAASTVQSILRDLESAHPALKGWVLDERGQIRRHINIYINGELGAEDSVVREHDRVEVLPAISGG